MENQNSKNFTFNNCTVTINEDQNSHETLKRKIEIEAKETLMQMDMINSIVAVVKQVSETYIKAKFEKEKKSNFSNKKPAKKSVVKNRTKSK
jgi:hypothetical protein